MELEDIRKLIESGRESEKALGELDAYIEGHPQSDEALTMRGKLHWALGHRSEAIHDHLAATKLNPASGSKYALQGIYEILNFYNKDLYNP